jgi:very-short-patch-repair endonuclease
VSEAEDALYADLWSQGVDVEREYRFAAEACGGSGKGVRKRLKAVGLRDWRSDFVIHDRKLLIEVEGGGWTGGRHIRGAGFEEDLQKYDAAVRLGWTVYRCSPGMINSGQAISTIMQLIDGNRQNGTTQSD